MLASLHVAALVTLVSSQPGPVVPTEASSPSTPAKPETDRETPTPLPGSKARAQRPKRGALVFVPPKRRKDRAEPIDRSQGGKLRGGLEFALGSVTTILTGALIGRGVWELTGGADANSACREPATPQRAETTPRPCTGASRGGQIAGGLALGLSVPMAVASGFLFSRGAKIHRDYLRWKAKNGEPLQIGAHLHRHGGSVSIGWRF